MTDTVAALRGKLKQLQARHRDGTLSQDDYDRERSALERALLDHVLDDKGGTAAPAAAATPAAKARPSAATVGLLSALVLCLAMAGYAVTGSPSLITGPPPAVAQPADAHQGADPNEFANAVERLAQKLKDQPDNAEGWAMLARSYMQMNRVADALPAFARAQALAGDDPRLLTDHADALAVSQDRSLEGEPTRLVERALKLDPDNLKALALAGTAAFNRKDFAIAVRHWERMQRLAPAESPFMPQLKSSIAEARQLAGLPPAPLQPATAAASPPTQPAGPASTTAPPATTAAPQPTAPAATAAAAAGPTLRGTVRLAPALANQAAPTDTVFVYARPAEGSRMPLAILRKQVKDLPLPFVLDDSMAMSPAGKLSMHPRVVLEARISKSGQTQASAGDLVARSAPLAHDAQGVVVEIAEVQK